MGAIGMIHGIEEARALRIMKPQGTASMEWGGARAAPNAITVVLPAS
jgi:hypothetical protein